MKCATCEVRTRHAVLRADEDRDEAELADHLNALPAQLEVHEILNEMRARSVRVRHYPDGEAGVGITWFLDDNTWHLTIYNTMPLRPLVEWLRWAQERIREPGGHKWWPQADSDDYYPSVGVFWAYRESD